jgi:hypothetical protein
LSSAGEGITAAAEKALQNAADGTKGSRHKHNWVPLLPSARSALLVVLVHTEGVEAAGKLLLSWKEDGGQPGHGHAAAAGRKGRAAGSAVGKETAGSTARTLLTLPMVNSFLAAAVSVVSVHQQEAAEEEVEAAAQAALQLATELFKQQLLTISMGAAGPVDVAAALPGAPAVSSADAAAMFACLAQLYGAVEDWQQLSSIVAAAVKQQLVGVQAGDQQVVLAGAAAALVAAGKHVAAVQLLDGLPAAGITAVSHPALARQLLAAAEKDDEAWKVSASVVTTASDYDNQSWWATCSGALSAQQQYSREQLSATAHNFHTCCDQAQLAVVKSLAEKHRGGHVHLLCCSTPQCNCGTLSTCLLAGLSTGAVPAACCRG